MSGLCGVVDFTGAPIAPEILREMAAVSRGLGPDGMFTELGRGAAFCHLALHATPQSLTERQPLRSPEGTVWVVADIRLDNREELIRLLAPEVSGGEIGDAALLLAAYRRWGVACPEHLLGDFAFVIWDERERRLLCVRDPLGIRSLHYARVGPLVLFASEAQQILQHPRVPRDLDERTVADYLAETWEDPERTFFLHVRRVPPAHRLAVTAAGERMERYWDIDPEHRIIYRDEREYAAHFLEVFRRSVADRLRAPDGPVAVAMSGGLDSTSVAAVAAASADLFACSFAFNSLQECDEREYVAATAGALRIETELVDTERFWLFGDDEAFRPRLETPFLAWESAFRDMLGRVQARGSRILLTGHGGDDLMAGSILVYSDRLLAGDLRVLLETGRHALRRGREGFRILYRYFGEPLLPSSIDRALHRLIAKSTRSEIPDWLLPELVERTGLRHRLPSAYKPARSSRGAAWQQFYDHVTHFCSWGQSCRWYDANASPFGIEARHPFFDRRVVELLFAIPPQQKAEPGCYKPLLRRAMTGLLPDAVRLRTNKTEFTAFLDLGLRQEREKIEKLLAFPRAAQMGLLDGTRLRAGYATYLNGDSSLIGPLLCAMTLEAWLGEISGAGSGMFPRGTGARAPLPQPAFQVA
jgi:asparagine synthase (glutamine-hydrolysing)